MEHSEAGPLRLICSVGVGDYKEMSYRLGEGEHRTRFSAVAVAQLVGRGKTKATASVILSDAAKQQWYECLAEELRGVGLTPHPVVISPEPDEEHLYGIFEEVVRCVHPGDRIILDVTSGLRHLPLIYFAALAYLTALRDVRLVGIFYGAYELRNDADGTVPVVELTPLFDLMQWYQATQSARNTGDLRSIAARLTADVSRLFGSQIGDFSLSKAKDSMAGLSDALAAGLLLEVGLRSSELTGILSQASCSDPRARAAWLALDSLKEDVSRWSIRSATRGVGVELTSAEIDRQLGLGEWYIARRDYPKGLMVLREVLVSAVILANGGAAYWLHLPERQRAEAILNAAPERARVGLATEDEGRLAAVWSSVRDARNLYAHLGMNLDKRERNAKKLCVGAKKQLQQCKELLSRGIRLEPRAQRLCLLVTPLGLTPGVLYTALSRLDPDACLVVTSAEGAERVPEVLEQAGRVALPHRILLFPGDPFTGFDRVRELVDARLKEDFVRASEVVINVTGGTTVLQYAVERLGDEARRLGVPTRRIALVDRRDSAEQRANPYVLGELIELEAGEEGTRGETESGREVGGVADER